MYTQEVLSAIINQKNVAFVGESGSGKTFALSQCLEYLEPTYGIISLPTTDFKTFNNIIYLSEYQGFLQTCPDWVHIVPETNESHAKLTKDLLDSRGSTVTTICTRSPKLGETLKDLFLERCTQLGIDASKFSVVVWCVQDGPVRTTQIV